MIVATLVPTAPQPVDPAQVALDASADPGRAPSSGDVAAIDFGQRLQHVIARPARDADARDANVRVAFPTETIVCGAARPAPDDADATPTTNPPTDDPSASAAADVAAQLALVSQWVPLAQVSANGTAAPTAETPARGPDAAAIVRGGVVRPDGANDLPKAATPTDSTTDVAFTRAVADATLANGTKPEGPRKEATREATRDALRAAAAAAIPTTTIAPAVATTAATALAATMKDALERATAPLDATPTTAPTPLAAALLQASTPGADASAPNPVAQSTLREPVGTSAWTEEFGRAAVHVATSSLKEASLRLNPEHLGPLDVRVRIDDGVAHLNFQAAHVDTRHALEASRPMLDQLFAAQGLTIANYSVDDRAPGSAGASTRDASSGADASRGQSGSGDSRSSQRGPTPQDQALDRVVAARLARPLGLVDTFA